MHVAGLMLFDGDPPSYDELVEVTESRLSRGVSPAARALLEGVDVLVHDAQFTEPERRLADDYGHATVEETVALAEQAGVGTLVLFHHSPVRTDDQLDRILEVVDSALPIVVAHEGMRVPVVARTAGATAADRAPGSLPSGT